MSSKKSRVSHRAHAMDPKTKAFRSHNRFSGLEIQTTDEESETTEQDYNDENIVEVRKKDRVHTMKKQTASDNKIKVEVHHPNGYEKNIPIDSPMEEDKISMIQSSESEYSESSIKEDRQDKYSPIANDNHVNSVALSPQKLMTIGVSLGDIDCRALVDTGATKNLIKKSIVDRLGARIGDDARLVFEGLGTDDMLTYGTIKTKLSFYKIDAGITTLHIVDDNVLKDPILLGQEFCQHNKLVIDLSKRRISKMDKNGSKIDLYLNSDDDGVIKNIQESIKVYAASDMEIQDGINKIPIVYDYNMCGSTGKDVNLYYEGTCGNQRIEGIDGVLNLDSTEKSVFIQRKADDKGKHKIKKGDSLGIISTIVEMEEEDVYDDAEWTFSRLKDKIEIGSKIDESGRRKILDMLLKTKRVLSTTDMDIGTANVTPHKIVVTDNTPFWQKPRRCAEPVNREIERMCEELELHDIIEKCKSPYSSPIVPVRKGDGTLRICIDYRKINSVTKQEHFPMPNLNDSIYAAHNIKFFTKLDLTKGYYQVPIDEDSRQYTSFSTQHNQYQFKRLSFGLRNSGIQFQRNIQEILANFSSRKVLIYIDDILILSNDFEEHLELVEKVLGTLMHNGIKVKVEKCEFFKDRVSFLGHMISKDGIEKSPEYIDKIQNFPKPTTITQMRRFLGLANFQRKFVKDFSTITKPLTAQTSGPKKKSITWTEEMNLAFETIKNKLVEEVRLSYPDYRKEANMLELFVDASEVGAGACLVQKQGMSYKTIAYSSTTFSAAEQKFSPIEREAMALRWGVRNVRPFIFGVKFILHTDHKPLLFLQNMARDNSKLARTMNELQDYDFVIQYRPGVENEAADTLSRTVDVVQKEDQEESGKLPPGLKVMKYLTGSGNSLFIALLMVLEDLSRMNDDIDLPSDHLELRKILVNHLLENVRKFEMKISNARKKEIKNMMYEGMLPCDEVIISACDLYNLEVRVHCGMTSPVVFKTNKDPNNIKIVNLQGLSGIHYNPVICIRKGKQEILKKNIQEVNVLMQSPLIISTEHETEEKELLIQTLNKNNQCRHKNYGNSCLCIVSAADINFCALADTGAQVSLITEDVWNKIKNSGQTYDFEEGEEVLTGIGDQKVFTIGRVHLRLKILNVEMDRSTPFAIVKTENKPWCSILGANFIVQNRIIMDFNKKLLHCKNSNDEEFLFPMQITKSNNDSSSSCFGMVHVQDTLSVPISGNIDLDESDSDVSDSDVQDSEVSDSKVHDSDGKIHNRRVQYKFDDNMMQIQQNDHAIRCLKTKISNNISKKKWKEKFLGQFKRYEHQLEIRSDVLVRKNVKYVSTVVPFPMMIDIVHKTHTQLAHIGRNKLFNIIQGQFWHPSLEKICGDICKCCTHCQFYKVSKQDIKAPTLKIQLDYPFQMISMDTMSLQKTPRRNTAVLVAIDHYSKWLIAIPIKDKTTKTICNLVTNNVFPNITRLPDKVLTDGGPEFRSHEFDNMLQKYDVSHIFSTPNKPSSNGCVERSNRTIIQLIKGIEERNPQDWDLKLSRAVIIYNTTLHSEIGQSPSELLLKTAHSFEPKIPIRKVWKAGHPKFSPYRVGQTILRKIHRSGNRVEDKLKPKYDGPFIIKRVQSNEVTYEVTSINTNDKSVKKVHYESIKLFIETPPYLKSYVEAPRHDQIDQDQEDSSSDEDESGIEFPICLCSDIESDDTENDVSASDEQIHGCQDDLEEILGNLVSHEAVSGSGTECGEHCKHCNKSGVKGVCCCKASSSPHGQGQTQTVQKIFRNSELRKEVNEESIKTANTRVNMGERLSTRINRSLSRIIESRNEDISLVALGNLQCSEMVNYEETPYDFVSSTPIRLISEGKFENNCEISPIDVGSMSDHFLEKTFISVMQEAWAETSLMLEELTTNVALIDQSSEIAVGDLNSSGLDSKSFAGFSSDIFEGIKLVEKVKKHAREYEQIVKNYGNGNDEFIRAMKYKGTTKKKKKPYPIASRPASGSGVVQRTTRSTGFPMIVPNVQLKTLEYRCKKK